MQSFRTCAAVFLLIALLALPLVFPHQASAAPSLITLAELRTRADQWLAPRWAVIQTRQENYFQSHGTYWQGLRTHIVDLQYTDATDAAAIADNLASAPTDQAENWDTFFPELSGTVIPAVVWIDVYNGPSGPGYVATLYACHNGNCYARSQQHGPESWRNEVWHRVELAADQAVLP